jgi:hypothetical protein
LLKFILGWFYDPNSQDEDIRRGLGRTLACSREEYDAGKFIP